jgi:hypothetical protein
MNNSMIGHNSGDHNLNDEDDNLASLDPEIITADLKVRYAKEFRRADDLKTAFVRFQEAHKSGFNDDDETAKAGEFSSQIKKAIKALETARKDEKEPFDAAAKVVHSLFKGVNDELDRNVREIARMQTNYLVKKEAEERAARKAAADEEAKRVAEEEAAALAAGADEEKLDAVIHQAQHAENLQKQAQASTADMSRVRGSFGGTTSLAKIRQFRVTDLSKVPAEFLMVDQAKVKAAIKDFKEGEAQPIAGIEVYFERTARSR